jgi:hypothetical protein
MYFDAPGSSICPWSLVGTGLKAFARMGADPYFKRVP